MAQKTWELSGDYMESCNCDYLCPCIYTNPQGPATHEHCTPSWSSASPTGATAGPAGRAFLRLRDPLRAA